MKKNKLIAVNMLAVAGIFCVFCITAVVVITYGARIFASSGQDIENHFTGPTSLYYINEKIRQNDTQNSPYLAEVDGEQALFIPSSVDEGYLYCIYYFDGFLRELYVAEDFEIVPSIGQQLVEVQDLKFTEEGDVFKAVVVTADGSEFSMLFDTYSGGAQ